MFQFLKPLLELSCFLGKTRNLSLEVFATAIQLMLEDCLSHQLPLCLLQGLVHFAHYFIFLSLNFILKLVSLSLASCVLALSERVYRIVTLVVLVTVAFLLRGLGGESIDLGLLDSVFCLLDLGFDRIQQDLEVLVVGLELSFSFNLPPFLFVAKMLRRHKLFLI